MQVVPGIDPSRILFTPNFAPRSEYEWALEQGVHLTIDNLYALREWGELFRGRDVLRPHRHRFRPRPPRSRAHGGRAFQVRRAAVRDSTRSSGWCSRSARASWRCMRTPAAACSTSATGRKSATCSAAWRSASRTSRAIDLGGGLGVPEKPGQVPVDLAALQARHRRDPRAVAAAAALARAGTLPGGAGRACWSSK